MRTWRSLNMCKPETGHLRITIHDNVDLKLCQVINRHDCNSNLPDINGDCERFEHGLGSASTWLSKALLIKHSKTYWLHTKECVFGLQDAASNLKAQDHGNRAWSFAVIVGIGIAPYLVWCSREGFRCSKKVFLKIARRFSTFQKSDLFWPTHSIFLQVKRWLYKMEAAIVLGWCSLTVIEPVQGGSCAVTLMHHLLLHQVLSHAAG